MEWLVRLNRAVEYLEENLAGEIDYAHAAHIACCSTFHFMRMFSYIAEIPLSEYVRRRRMTSAAFDLQGGDAKVIDIALKYGYDSPTAFSRAFQSVHGISPSAARQEGVTLKAYPRMHFHITIKGDAEMDYRIEKKDAFRVAGVMEHFQLNVEENFSRVPQFWGETVQSGKFAEILSICNGGIPGALGISTCMDGRAFDYYIACATDKPVPPGMAEYTVPAATWAIFPCTGPMPAAIQALQKRIITEWLPTSGYEYADAPDIEVYFEGDVTAPDYQTEVWLPVVKKA